MIYNQKYDWSELYVDETYTLHLISADEKKC